MLNGAGEIARPHLLVYFVISNHLFDLNQLPTSSARNLCILIVKCVLVNNICMELSTPLEAFHSMNSDHVWYKKHFIFASCCRGFKAYQARNAEITNLKISGLVVR